MSEDQVKEIVKGMLIPISTTLYAIKGCSINEAVQEGKKLLQELDINTLISEINEVV